MTLAYTHPIFEANQVLTHAHLNSLREYLEQQVKDTRRCLIGTGIPCGLMADLDTTNQQVTISDGCGVTSAGLLICVEDCNLPFFRLNQVTNSNSNSTVNIWELLETDEADQRTIQNFARLWDKFPDPGTTAAIAPVSSLAAGFFDDKVALLYLEEEKVDENNCVLNNCDATGPTVNFIVNKLLMTKADLEAMMRDVDSNLDQNLSLDENINRRFNYADRRLPRFKANNPDAPDDADLINIFDYDQFVESYETINAISLGKFNNCLTAAYVVFNPLVQDLYSQADINATITALEAAQTINNTYLQNYYDLMRALFKSCAEFTDTAFDILYQCCPVNNTHPYHLMLGEVPLPDDCKPSPCRNYFMQPPVYNNMAKDLKKARHQFRRTMELADAFYTPSTGEIAFTPSKGLAAPLGEQAIPYIFDVVNGPPTIPELWSYELYRRCRSNLALSFHRHDDASLPDQVARPFQYSLDDRPFLRIEGHLAFELEDAVNQITNLRTRFNVCFDIISLSIDGNGVTNINDPDAISSFQADYLDERNNFLFEIDNCFGPVIVDSDQAFRDRLDALRIQVPNLFEDFVFSSFMTAYKAVYDYAIDSMYDDIQNYQQYNDLTLLADALRDTCESVTSIKACMERALYRILDIYYRYQQYQRPVSFSEFTAARTGLEHLGGVYQGGTFILVYETRTFPLLFNLVANDVAIAIDNVPTLPSPNRTSRTRTANTASRNLTPLAENLNNLPISTNFPISTANFQFQERDIVVGDFAVPYKCCGVSDLITVGEVTVEPYALQECMVFLYDFSNGQSDVIEVVPDLFNPQDYRLTFNDSTVNGLTTNHGQVDLEFRPYGANSAVSKQYFRYTLTNPYSPTQEPYTTDTFEFFLRDNNDNIIDQNTVNVFIVFEDGSPSGVAVMYGTITRFGNPLDGVSVQLTSQTGLQYGTTSNADGTYLLDGVEFGTYTVRIDASNRLGFPARRTETLVVNQGNVNRNYSMNMQQPFTATNVTLLNTAVFDPTIFNAARTEDFSNNLLNLRTEEEGKKATGYFDQELMAAKSSTAKILKSKETPSKETIDLLEKAFKAIDGKNTGPRSLNTAYNKAIAALGEEMKDAKDKRKNALGNLVADLSIAYFIRLALEYPAELAPGSANALKNTDKVLGQNDLGKQKNVLIDWAKKSKEQLTDFTYKVIIDTFSTRS